MTELPGETRDELARIEFLHAAEEVITKSHGAVRYLGPDSDSECSYFSDETGHLCTEQAEHASFMGSFFVTACRQHSPHLLGISGALAILAFHLSCEPPDPVEPESETTDD